MSCHRFFPITKIKNVGPVLFAALISISVSVFERYPELYNSVAALAPKGKPHNAPISIGVDAQLGSDNNFETGIMRPNISAAPLETIIEDMIIKGNRDGIIFCIVFFIAENALSAAESE